MGIVTHLAKSLTEMAEENKVTKYGSVTLEVGLLELFQSKVSSINRV